MDDKIKERCKTCEKQCMQEDLDRSRSCRVAIEQKLTLMDRTAIEHLPSRQKVSRWIKNLSRSYQDKVQKARCIEIALTFIKTRRKRGSIDSNLSKDVEKLSRCAKIVFQRRKKHIYECNQTCYSTKDPKNMLNSQNHLSTRKMTSIQIQNTHIHTYTKQV